MAVDGVDEAGGGEVGVADANGVAVGFGGEVADEDAADEWGGLVGGFGEGAVVALDAAADDVGIDAGAADVFAHLIYDEEIDFFKGDEGHEAAGLLAEFGFAFEDLVARNKVKGGGFVVMIFEDGEAGEDGGVRENDLGHFANDFFVAEAAGGNVHGGGAFFFAEADDAHFDKAAPDGAEEIGVWFDAVDEDDVIGTEGGRAAEDGGSGGSGPNLADFHGSVNGRDFFGDVVCGEDVGLSFRCGAAVAAHGWKNERARAGGAEEVDDVLDDLGKIVDAAAANADGDGGVGFELRAKGGELLFEGLRDVEVWARREVLAEAGHFGNRDGRAGHNRRLAGSNDAGKSFAMPRKYDCKRNEVFGIRGRVFILRNRAYVQTHRDDSVGEERGGGFFEAEIFARTLVGI